MPLNARTTWTANQLVGASDLNAQIRDNINYLLNERPFPSPITRFAYYNTSSTTFVDIDAANLIQTLTINSGRMAVFCAMGLHANNIAGNFAAATVILDSATRAGSATYGLAAINQNTAAPTSFFALFTGLSVGSHNVKIQWKANTGGTISNSPDFLFGATAFCTIAAWEA